MGKFVVKETATGFKFDLKATNGQVIATSEVYASEDSCMNGVKSVAANAPIANLEDQTWKTTRSQSIPSLKCTRTRRGNSASV